MPEPFPESSHDPAEVGWYEVYVSWSQEEDEHSAEGYYWNGEYWTEDNKHMVAPFIEKHGRMFGNQRIARDAANERWMTP